MTVLLVPGEGESLGPILYDNTMVTVGLSKVSGFKQCFSLQVQLQGRVRAGKRLRRLEGLLPPRGKEPNMCLSAF